MCAGTSYGAPGLEFVLQARVFIAPGIELGGSSLGCRRIVQTTGGDFHGPRLSGTVLEEGEDTQLLRRMTVGNKPLGSYPHSAAGNVRHLLKAVIAEGLCTTRIMRSTIDIGLFESSCIAYGTGRSYLESAAQVGLLMLTQESDIASLPSVYDPVARATHWLTVLLVMAEYVVGSVMPGIHRGTPLGPLISWHLALGSGLLLLVLFRILWRVFHRPPPPASELPLWQKRLAKGTHFALYLVLILMPLTGWAAASVRAWPVRAFGLVPLPALVPYRAGVGLTSGGIHADVLYWILLGLIGVHVGSALYHRFVRRDTVLHRMLPLV